MMHYLHWLLLIFFYVLQLTPHYYDLKEIDTPMPLVGAAND